MSRTTRTIAAVIAVIVVAALLVLAYIWFSGGSGEPSAPISAPTLPVATESPTSAPTQEPTVAATTETDATPDASAAATPDATAEAAASGPVVFNITPEQSQVSFTLTEELRGQPTTVVGTTDQVAGQIAVDFANPANSQVGEIRINARTLATDQ